MRVFPTLGREYVDVLRKGNEGFGMVDILPARTNPHRSGINQTLGRPGLGSTDSDPGKTVALLADNQGAMRAFYQIIFLAFGVSLIFLSMALYERLKAGSAVLAQAATIFTLIWAVLVIVVGTLSINDLSTVVELHGENPAQAATVWLTLDSVETGLGAGGGETMVSALWFLLLSWAALRARVLPRLLIYGRRAFRHFISATTARQNQQHDRNC